MSMETTAKLKTAVLAWLDESATDLDSDDTLMDSFIRIAEENLNRMLRVKEMVCLSRLYTEVDGSGNSIHTYALPDDFGGVRYVRLAGEDIDYLTPEQAQFVKGLTGTERVGYTLWDGNIWLVPDPAENTLLEIMYYQRIPSLVEQTNPPAYDRTTNWLLTKYPDAYLFGVLDAAHEFIYDEGRAQRIRARFEGIISQIDQIDQIDRWSGSSLSMKVG